METIMNNPLVSVIMPVYNDGSFVLDSIKSVINQTYKNLEVIVIDDCSSDDTVSLIESTNDPRIRLFKNSRNKGAAFCRNLGIRESRGQYIAFLDGDDIWESNKTELQLKYMLENDFKFSSTYFSQVDENGKQLGKRIESPKRMTHKTFLRTDFVGCLTVMYKKDVCPDLEIPNDILKRNDYALWLKLSEKTDCYAFPKVLAFHRKRYGSLSSTKKTKLYKYHRELFKKLYGFNDLKCEFYALRNVFYYFIRKMFFMKKQKSD